MHATPTTRPTFVPTRPGAGRFAFRWAPCLAEGLLVLVSLMGVRLSGLRLVRRKAKTARICGKGS